MRIIFMGNPDFAVPTLEKLVQSDHDIIGVVTGPDKRRGRGGNTSPTPVKAAALKHQLPVIESDSANATELLDKLRQLKPDLFVVVAFKILPAEALAIPAIGSVNLHASLLPKYRGAAPIHWSLINGEKETGCTVFFLDESVDTGKILMQKRTAVSIDDTTGAVYARLMHLGADLMREAVDVIATGNYQLKSQDETLATPAPKIFPGDCLIDPEKSAEEVHNFIRGMSPFPGAWCYLDGKQLKIYRTKVLPGMKTPTGLLMQDESKILLGCKEGAVELLEVKLEGRKKMSAWDLLNGYQGDKKVSFSTQ